MKEAFIFLFILVLHSASGSISDAIETMGSQDPRLSGNQHAQQNSFKQGHAHGLKPTGRYDLRDLNGKQHGGHKHEHPHGHRYDHKDAHGHHHRHEHHGDGHKHIQEQGAEHDRGHEHVEQSGHGYHGHSHDEGHSDHHHEQEGIYDRLWDVVRSG